MSRATAAFAYAETCWATRPGLSRARFEAWQARKLQHWLERDVPRVRFYAGHAPRLDALPVIEKADVMADFAAFNQAGITAEAGWAALETGGQVGDVSIGCSTGTSGNRGLYAITTTERYRWLGTILAKALPGFWRMPERVAVILPQSSALYEAANQTGRIALRFFDLRDGIGAISPGLVRFVPTTIVAPPRVLRHLTEERLAPRRIFAAGETLDPNDRALIEAAFGQRLGQIYMATEGLFAVTCREGRLHLAEDANHFAFEPVAGGLVTPIVSSFRRQFQILARYRMNDLLRLAAAPCPCGSPLRGVEEVVGRMDDLMCFGGKIVTPDVLRNAVLGASREITDFRLVQTGKGLTLTLPPEIGDEAAKAATDAVIALLNRQGITARPVLQRAALAFDPSRKLRRVENRVSVGSARG